MESDDLMDLMDIMHSEGKKNLSHGDKKSPFTPETNIHHYNASPHESKVTTLLINTYIISIFED